jgi:hypothetical protein
MTKKSGPTLLWNPHNNYKSITTNEENDNRQPIRS